MMLDAIRESGGLAMTGREERIGAWRRRASAAEGVGVCPETAVCYDCLEQLRQRGLVRTEEAVEVYNTGAAQKDLEALPVDLPRLDRNAPVEQALAGGR
jgi:threonine synthase